MTICQHCGQWKIKGTDDYCGYCGFLQMPISVESLKIKLISGIVPEKSIKFVNNGDRECEIEILPSNHSFNGLIFTPSNSFSLTPKEPLEIAVQLDALRLPEDFSVETFKYVCMIDNDKRKTFDLEVIVKAGPNPVALTDAIRFGDVEEGKKSNSWVEICNKGGIPLQFKDASVEGSDQFHVHVSRSFNLLAPGEKVKLPVIWESPGTEPKLNTDALGVRINFKNSDEELFIPIVGELVKFHLSAEPTAVHILEALSKQAYSRKITLTNHGTKDIEITAIETEQNWIQIESKANNFSLLCPGSTLKETVGATVFNESYTFEVFLFPGKLEEGLHKGKVRVRTTKEDTQVDIDIQLYVICPKPCNDYIGIDFGTTNSVVAIWDDGINDILLVEDEHPSTRRRTPLIPSVLVFHGSPEKYKIGSEAEAEANVYPEMTVRSIKRIMGYGNERIFFDKKFSPEELAALIIKKLVEYAEERLYKLNRERQGTYLDIRKAIVTVPANFYDLQIRGILEACKKAEIDIEEEVIEEAANQLREAIGQDVNTGVILDEPSAAALFYLSNFQADGKFDTEFTEKFSKEENIRFLVFDYGGGTLDVSVVQVGKINGGDIGIKVLANKGDNNIGGDSIDIAIMRAVLKECKKQYKEFDVSIISMNYNELERRRQQEGWDRDIWAGVLSARGNWKKAAEMCKISLDNQIVPKKVNFEINESGKDIIAVNNGRIQYIKGQFQTKVNRQQVANWIDKILKRCEEVVREALKLVEINSDNIDYIIHTGRSSLMPMIREKVKGIFPKLPKEHDILNKENLKVCVAKGAALYGLIRSGIAMGQQVRLVSGGRRLPHSYGVQVMKGFTPMYEPIIEIGREYPTEETKHYPDTPGTRYLNLKFIQNSGKNNTIRNNSDIRVIGSQTIDTLADGIPGCDIKFIIDPNRKMEVTADGQLIEIEPVRLEEEERWIG